MIRIRYVRYAFCIIYNLIRLPLKSLFCFGKAKFGKLQLIRPGVKILIEGANAFLTIKKANILSNTFLHVDGGKLFIGNNVFINRNCNIVAQECIKIDDGCTIGPNVCIYDHDHVFEYKNSGSAPFKKADVIIGKRVWIGANAIILRGTIIGDDCIIGAGTVIKGNIPSNKMVVQKNFLNYYDLK